MGMLTGGRHPHTKQALVPALAGTKEQGEAPSGARVAQAHSDAGRFPKRVLGRKSQSSTMDNYPAHTSVDGLRFGSSPH